MPKRDTAAAISLPLAELIDFVDSLSVSENRVCTPSTVCSTRIDDKKKEAEAEEEEEEEE